MKAALAFALLVTAAPFAHAAEIQVETVWIPMTERTLLGGTRELRLEGTLYRPGVDGAHPTLVFNHGSTGAGRGPATDTLTYTETARFFAERGWAVLVPMRRGRGASGGEYLEQYDCDIAVLSRGVERAIEDLDAVMAFVMKQSWVDRSRFLLGGMSRGGFLSIVYASTRATSAKGVVNMAGGWTIEPCDRRIGFHESTLARAGRTATLPMLWLYAENDRNYGPGAIRSYHIAFTRAGGTAELHVFPPIGRDGHILMPRSVSVWNGVVDDYLHRLGLGAR